MSNIAASRLQRLREIIDEMTDVRDLPLVQDVHFFSGAMMVRFAPRAARKHKAELVRLLNLIFPTDGGGLRSGMTSEDFKEVLGEMFLAVQVIAAGCLLGLWKAVESPALTNPPARLVLTSVRLW